MKLFGGTLLRRIVDGALFLIVGATTNLLMEFGIDVDEWKEFLSSMDMIPVILVVMLASLGIGILQILGHKCGLLKEYEKKSLKDRVKVVIALPFIAAVLSGIGMLVIMLLDLFPWSQKTDAILRFVIVLLIVMILHCILFGYRSVLLRLLEMVARIVRWVIIGIVKVVSFVKAVIIKICDVLGERFLTALGEIVLCFLSTKLLMYVCRDASFVLKIMEQDSHTLEEWVSSYSEMYFLNYLGMDASSGILGEIADMEVSASTYAFLQFFPFGCAIAGIICMLVGIGYIGILSRSLVGWQSGLMDAWDRQHPEEKRYNWATECYEWSNGNPHGILILILGIVLLGMNAALGLYMPVFILANLIIGIVMIIPRVIRGTRE